MSHFPSSSFQWTSTTNQEYLEKNNFCSKNLATRFTYPALALVAIIESVGSAVAAVFVSFSLVITCCGWGARKVYAFNLWKRSASAALSVALDILGVFSPALTAKCIELITLRFPQKTKEEKPLTQKQGPSDGLHPSKKKEVEKTEKPQQTATQQDNSQTSMAQFLKKLNQRPQQSQLRNQGILLRREEESLKQQLLDKCQQVVKEQNTLPLPINCAKALFEHFLKQSQHEKLSGTQEQINNFQALIKEFDAKAASFFHQLLQAFFYQLLQDRLQNGKHDQRITTNASKAWQEIFGRPLEYGIGIEIQKNYSHPQFDSHLLPEAFQKALDRIISSNQKGEMKTDFQKVFWNQKYLMKKYTVLLPSTTADYTDVAKILSLKTLLELDGTASTDEYQRAVALLENLPTLSKLANWSSSFLEELLTSRTKGTIIEKKLIIEEAHKIFVSCVQKQACQSGANFQVPEHKVIEISKQYLVPIVEENKKEIAEAQKRYDEWLIKAIPGHDPSNPSSIAQCKRWEIYTKTLHQERQKCRGTLKEFLDKITSEEEKVALLKELQEEKRTAAAARNEKT